MKGYFDVHLVLLHETGFAWIQVPKCSFLYVLQGHMVGFSFGYMGSRFADSPMCIVFYVCLALRKILEVGSRWSSVIFCRLGQSPYRRDKVTWNLLNELEYAGYKPTKTACQSES